MNNEVSPRAIASSSSTILPLFTKTKNQRVALIALLLAAIGGGAFLWLSRASSSEAGFILVQDYLDQEKTIQYIGNVDDTGSPFGVVMYDASRPEDLLHYVEASQARGQELVASGVKELYIWITFRQPVNVSAFEVWAKQTGFDVKRFYLRALGQNDERIGISGAPGEGAIVPFGELDSAMNSVQTHENNRAQLKGIFEAVGVISAQGYQELVRDPRVFLVDVTGTLIYLHPNFQRQTHMTWKEFASRFQIDGGPGGPYWYVEDYGLGAPQP